MASVPLDVGGSRVSGKAAARGGSPSQEICPGRTAENGLPRGRVASRALGSASCRPGFPCGDRGYVLKGRRQTGATGRFVAALGFSIACHAALLVARSGDSPVSGASPQPDAIAVAVLERGEPAGGVLVDSGVTPAAPAVSSGAPMRSTAAAETTVASVSSRSRGERSRSARKPSVESAAADADTTAAGNEHADGAAANEHAGTVAAKTDGLGAGASPLAGGAGAGGRGGDLRARCRDCPTPEYPVRARRQGWQGTVDVDLRVDRHGVVERASVERSSGFALLDAAAVTVARRSRFWVSGGGEGLRGQLRYRFVLEEARSDRSL